MIEPRSPHEPLPAGMPAAAILLHVLTITLAVLDLPIAITAPMNVGMTEGAAGHRVLWAEAFGILCMSYPVACVVGLIVSSHEAGRRRPRASIVAAAAPLVIAIPMIVLAIAHWE